MPIPNEHLNQFKPGQSGNPAGRPKGIPNTATRLRKFLELTENMRNPITGADEKFTIAEIMDLMQINKARKGDTKAYQMLMDRMEGRPNQAVDLTTNGKDLPTPILQGIKPEEGKEENVSADDRGEETLGIDPED